MLSETEPARLAQWFLWEPLKRMGGLVSLPPANGLGLLVPLPCRERIADCAEIYLLHAAGNTRTTLHPSELKSKGTSWSVTRRCREDGTSYRVEHMIKGPDDLPALAAIFED